MTAIRRSVSAENVTFDPTGTVSATNVQDAITEVASGAVSSSDGVVLDGSTSIGASTITVSDVPLNLKVGSLIAIDPGTSNCEVRRVRIIAGNTLTMNTVLKVAHNNATAVWIPDAFYLPLQWWGANVYNGSFSTDSYRSLINAFMDQAEMSGMYGLSGLGTNGNAFFSTSRPLFVNDYTCARDMYIQAIYPFAYDTMDGGWNDVPNQYLMTMAGQYGTATFNAATNEVTFSSVGFGPEWADVAFWPRPGSTMPAGIEEGKRYYTTTSSLTTTISKNYNDSTPVDFTTAGSGELVYASAGLARWQATNIRLAGSFNPGLNGLHAVVMEPSRVDSLRVESFAGVGLVAGGQQGVFTNTTVYFNHIGVELQGAEFIWFKYASFNYCDRSIWFSGTDRGIELSDNSGVAFDNIHFESAGLGGKNVQHLYGNGAPLTSGTFQLRAFNQTTAAINYNASAADVQAALEGLAAINPGDAVCTLLDGTNLSDGHIEIDFTQGQYNYYYFDGSTSYRGGELEILNSTVVGPLYSDPSDWDGASVYYERGWGNSFTGCYGSFRAGKAWLKTAGKAIDVSEGTKHGFNVNNMTFYAAGPGCPAIVDSLHGVNLLCDDGSVNGCAQQLPYYVRPSRHEQYTGCHWWYMGDLGRRVKLNTRGAPQLDIQAESTQADDIAAFTNKSGVVAARIDEDGYLIVKNTSAPADASVSASELAFWFDSTNGNPLLSFKAKQADGTVKTGNVALTTSATSSQQSGTAYTLALSDANSIIEFTNGSAVTLTVPPNASVAFPLDTVIELTQYGAGQVTVTAGAGVTINAPGSKYKLGSQYAGASLRKRATNEWMLEGDLTA